MARVPPLTDRGKASDLALLIETRAKRKKGTEFHSHATTFFISVCMRKVQKNTKIKHGSGIYSSGQ